MRSFFRAWRCGGDVLVDEGTPVPAFCPDHPDAEALGRTEDVGMVDPWRPRGVRHDPPPPF